MDKQAGALELPGTIGDITSNKTNDDGASRQKKRSKVVANDRTKENMQDYALAASGARLIRETLADIIDGIKDSSFKLRLNEEMSKVVKADTVNPRGSRNISDGNIGLLQGMEVNNEMLLGSTLKAPFEAFIDRESGLAKVDFPSLITAALLNRPKFASHFRLTFAGAWIDFVTGKHSVAQEKGEYLPISNEGVHAPSLEVQLPPAGTATLLLTLGISFYDKVNRHFYLIGDGRLSAVAFVTVSGS